MRTTGFAKEMEKIANTRLGVYMLKRMVPGAVIGGTAGYLYGKGGRKEGYQEEAWAGATAGAGFGAMTTGMAGGVAQARKLMNEKKTLEALERVIKNSGVIEKIIDEPGGILARQKQIMDTEAKFNVALDHVAKKTRYGFGANVNSMLRRIAHSENISAQPAQRLRKIVTELEKERRSLLPQMPLPKTWKRGRKKPRTTTMSFRASMDDQIRDVVREVQVEVRPSRFKRRGLEASAEGLVGPKLSSQDVRKRLKSINADIRQAIKDLKVDIAEINKEIKAGDMYYTDPRTGQRSKRTAPLGSTESRTFGRELQAIRDEAEEMLRRGKVPEKPKPNLKPRMFIGPRPKPVEVRKSEAMKVFRTPLDQKEWREVGRGVRKHERRLFRRRSRKK